MADICRMYHRHHQEFVAKILYIAIKFLVDSYMTSRCTLQSRLHVKLLQVKDNLYHCAVVIFYPCSHHRGDRN